MYSTYNYYYATAHKANLKLMLPLLQYSILYRQIIVMFVTTAVSNIRGIAIIMTAIVSRDAVYLMYYYNSYELYTIHSFHFCQLL